MKKKDRLLFHALLRSTVALLLLHFHAKIQIQGFTRMMCLSTVGSGATPICHFSNEVEGRSSNFSSPQKLTDIFLSAFHSTLNFFCQFL